MATRPQDIPEDPLTALTNEQLGKSSGVQAPAAPQQDASRGDTLMDGYVDSGTFGFSDELGGLIKSVIPGFYNGDGTRTQNVYNSGSSLSDLIALNATEKRRQLAAEADQHPGYHIAGELAGGLAVPFGAGARTVGAFARIGAIQGALYGIGSGEGLQGRVAGGAEGAATGFALGGALGGLVKGVGVAFRRVVGTAGAEAAQGTEAAVEGATAPTKVVGWGSDRETGQEFPIFGPHLPEEVQLSAPKEGLGGADEKPVGTISREGLQALADDTNSFIAKAAAGDVKATDVLAGTTEAEHAGAFRLGNLGTVEDTSSLLRALVGHLQAKGVQSDADLMTTAHAVASGIDGDTEAMAAFGQHLAGSLGNAAQGVAAFRTVLASATQEINAIHFANVDWMNAEPELVATAGEAIRNLSVLHGLYAEVKTGLGRGLRAVALPDAESYLKQLAAKTPEEAAGVEGGIANPAGTLNNPPPLPTNKGQLKDWFDLWGMLDGDPAKQAQYVQNLLTIPTPGKYLRTSVANWFTAAILSRPRTILLNLVGPSFIATLRNMETMSGAALGALSPFTSMEQKAAMWEAAKATPVAWAQTLGDVGDTLKYAAESFTANRSIIGGGGATHDALTTYGPFTDNLLQAANKDPAWQYTLGNMINVFPKAYARINNGLDETAKRLSAMGAIRVRALTDAATQGLEGDAKAAFVSDALTKAFDETGHLRDEGILRSAEQNTLTSTPGEEGSWVRAFSQGLQRLRADIPEVRFILPVFNVSANALGGTFARLPVVGMFRGELAFARDLSALKGELGPVEQAEAHGRMLSGAAFLTGGMLLNRAGLLTGAGPQQPGDRRVWLQTHQPYSIRVGDTWVRYDKFDIMGGLLSIPATIADATTNRAPDKGMEDLMLSGAGALAQWFKDRAALRTASSLFELGDNPTADASHVATQMGGSISAGMIPAGLGATSVDATDPYQRLKHGWLDYMKAAIPGLSNTLEPVRNALGEPMNRAANTWAEGFLPTTFAPATTYKSDPVLDEMDRLYRATGYGAGSDPKSLGYGFFDPRQVQLEDGRSLYDHAMGARQEIQLDGKTLRQSLGELFQSGEYNSAVDADPMQAQTSLGDASRGYMVKRVFDRYNAAIKAELGDGSPRALSYLTAAAAKLKDDAYLKDTTAEDLVQNPSLYQSHGVNPQPYAENVRRGATGQLLEALQAP